MSTVFEHKGVQVEFHAALCPCRKSGGDTGSCSVHSHAASPVWILKSGSCYSQVQCPLVASTVSLRSTSHDFRFLSLTWLNTCFPVECVHLKSTFTYHMVENLKLHCKKRSALATSDENQSSFISLLNMTENFCFLFFLVLGGTQGPTHAGQCPITALQSIPNKRLRCKYLHHQLIH